MTPINGNVGGVFSFLPCVLLPVLAVRGALGYLEHLRTVDDFFAGENLTLPPGRTWRNASANVFSVVDGKRLLFENDNSLFQQLRAGQPSVPLVRERVAMSMRVDEIHDDVHAFIGRLVAMTEAD